MSETSKTLVIGGVELSAGLVAERFPLASGDMTVLEGAESLARMVAAEVARRSGEAVLFLRLSGTVNHQGSPVAVTFAVAYGRQIDERTFVDNRPDTITVTAEEVMTAGRWLTAPAAPVDQYDALVERMSEAELRAAARCVLVANGWLSLDPEDLEDEHRDYADAAIRQGVPGFVEAEETAFAHSSELEDDVARANYWRGLMGYAALDSQGYEVIPAMTATVTIDGREEAVLSDPVHKDDARAWCRATAEELGASQVDGFRILLELDNHFETTWGDYTFRLAQA